MSEPSEIPASPSAPDVPLSVIEESLLAVLRQEIPNHGTKLIHAPSILKAVTSHKLTPTQTAVFLLLVSSYGTRHDGSLRESRSALARKLDLTLAHFHRAYRRLLHAGLVDADGLVTLGMNHAYFETLAEKAGKAKAASTAARRSKAADALRAEMVTGGRKGWKMTYLNGIGSKLKGHLQWALYWMLYMSADLHGVVGNPDDTVHDIARAWREAGSKVTNRVADDCVGAMIAAGALSRGEFRGVAHLAVLNSVQEAQIAYIRNTYRSCFPMPAHFTDETHWQRKQAEDLHADKRSVADSAFFNRLSTLLDGHDNFGRLYDGVRLKGSVETGTYTDSFITKSRAMAIYAGLESCAPEKSRLTDREPPSLVWQAMEIIAWPDRIDHHQFEPLLVAILCRKAGVPVPSIVADRLREQIQHGCDPERKDERRAAPFLSHDALNFVAWKTGLLHEETDSVGSPKPLIELCKQVIDQHGGPDSWKDAVNMKHFYSALIRVRHEAAQQGKQVVFKRIPPPRTTGLPLLVPTTKEDFDLVSIPS